jgi:FixJ family two-component response regulator
MTTVFLVDDDSSVRKALARLIRAAGYEVAPFASARQFLESKPETAGVACLVLDVRMPGVNGLELQEALQAAKIAIPIIFITGYGDIPMGVQAMKAGAVDFLPKPVCQETLLPAIEQALARAAGQRAEAAQLVDIRRRLESLTPREREVMALVVTGMLNKQIAWELGTVEKTIKVHRSRVMEKMAVDSIAELVRLAEKVGIPAQKQPTAASAHR